METRYWEERQARRMNDEQGPSLGDLLGRLTNEFSRLIRLEIQLAKTEVSEKASSIGQGAGVVAGGAVLALVGLTILAMAVGYLLATFMPLWLGFLLTAALFLGVGGALAVSGMKKIQKTPMQLRRTEETIDENKQWMRKEAGEVKRDPTHLGHRP